MIFSSISKHTRSKLPTLHIAKVVLTKIVGMGDHLGRKPRKERTHFLRMRLIISFDIGIVKVDGRDLQIF